MTTSATNGGPHAGLAQRAFGGLLLTFAQSGASRFLGFFTQIALAYLLQPADFGLIAIANSISGLVSTFIGLGVEDVILQRSRTVRLWASPAFGLVSTLSFAGASLVMIVAPFAAGFYHSPVLTGVLAVIAATMVVNAFASVQSVILRAEMRFGFIAGYTTFEVVLQSLLTVILAFIGAGVYSFVVPLLVSAGVRAVVYWRATLLRLDFSSVFRRWNLILGRSLSVAGSRFLVGFIGQGDYLVISLLDGKQALGQYYFAFRLAAVPLWVLAGNFATVLMPVLSRLRAEGPRQRAAAVRAAGALNYCVMLVAFGAVVVAPPVLKTLFGTKWIAAIPILQVLSVGLALDSMSWVAGSLMASRGAFAKMFFYTLPQVPIFLGFVLVGALINGPLGVAWGVALFYLLTQPVYVYAAFKGVGMRKWDVAVLYLRPLLAGALSALAATAATAPLEGVMPPLIGAGLKGAVQVLSFLALAVLFDRGVVLDLLERVGGLRSLVRRFLPS